MSLNRVVSRPNIECPGDMILFNCSIHSNSETIHLIWRVILTGQTPIDIAYYNETSDFGSVPSLNGYFTSSLTRYTSDEYIESTLVITVQPDASSYQFLLQCLIESLGNDSIDVLINSSSK